MNKTVDTYYNGIGKIFGSLKLLNVKEVLSLLEILQQENMRIYGFDGFILQADSSVQIEQNYSRDYSRFSKDDAYALTKEYFLKLPKDGKNIYFEMSYDKS